MALFKKKSGGTKVGNALRSAFTVPAGSKPVIQINKPSIPTFGSSNLGNTLGNIGSTIKSGVSSIGSVQKPVSKFGTPTITPTVSKNTGVMSGSGQNMSPAIKSPNMSPAFIGPRQGSNRSQNMSPAIQSQNISPAFIGPMPSGNSTNGGGSWGGSSARKTISNTGSRSGTSYSGISTGGGATGAGSGSLATPTGAATIGNEDFNYNKTPQQIAEEEALRRTQDYNDQQSQQDTNYENIMRDTLRQFQGEIDATNQVYADKLRVAGIQGQSRLGQQRAENFNAGAVNSSFGNAAQDRTQSYNNDVEAGIQAQKLQSLAQIENSARELGNKYYEQKKAAKESGLAGYLENIKSAGTQKEAIATDIATNMINSGLTVDEISPAKLELIAKNAGVPLQQIKTTFKALKDAKEKEAAEAALKGQFDLSEGQARYDAKGNMIASRAKTYKGGSGGGTGSVSASAVFSSFPADIQSAAQSIIDGKSKLNEYPSAKRLQINAAMSKLYTAEGGNELAQGAYDAITELETNPGFRSAIGSNRLLGAGKKIQGSKSAGYLGELDRLKANLKLVNIKYLKGTGAISDAEGKTLEDASTSLSERLPEKQFKAELARVKAALLKASNISTGSSAQSTEEDEALLSEFDL